MTVWAKIKAKSIPFSTALQKWYDTTGRGQYSLHEISSATGIDTEQLIGLLDLLVEANLVDQKRITRCINCHNEVDDASHRTNSCRICADEQPLETRQEIAYLVQKNRTRDIHWMMVIHGMNTVGTWQQEFSWMLSNHYKHAVPVYIYKYGNIKIKPMLLLSRRRSVKQLAHAIRQLQKQSPTGKPDVLAHSYGTLLLSEIIQNPSYDDIQLGRVILVGSIVRPDFDWAAMQANGRIEGVMCHHSKQDHIVSMAQFTIPGSGPSGNLGFNDQQSVIHHQEQHFGHSTYFEETSMQQVFPELWLPFLTASKPKPTEPEDRANWQPSILRFITHPMKLLMLLSILTLIAMTLIASVQGFDATWDQFVLVIKRLFD